MPCLKFCSWMDRCQSLTLQLADGFGRLPRTLARVGCVVAPVMLAVFFSDYVAAQPGPTGPLDAATTRAMADPDFLLQGEYQGTVVCAGRRTRDCRGWGLQVRAQGNGQFLIVEYPGGLPGAGWCSSTHYTIRASRDAGALRVESDGYTIDIDGHAAVVRGYDGRLRGQLTKIYRQSPTLGAPAPPGAVVLFDGTDTEHFRRGKIDENGWLQNGAEFRDAYGDFFLHLEFRLPYTPQSRGQGRGNSGVYIHSRYEVQILDSFGLAGRFNECGALYRAAAPRLNMCLPPLQWQTYDIDFRTARFDAQQRKTSDACISVQHNGVYVHYRFPIANKTGAGQAEGPEWLPIKLQDHGDPVVFRNIWLIERGQRRNSASG